MHTESIESAEEFRQIVNARSSFLSLNLLYYYQNPPKKWEGSSLCRKEVCAVSEIERPPENRIPDQTSQVQVVGVGASAGGLEALQAFFQNMPEKTGLAFVVIQHLSPDYKSLMDELLARHTSIPILIAQDGMDIQADHIYLLPPRKNISIFHSRLYLADQGPHKGLNLPVDIFFRSLALDKGKDSIGIVLSGTGSDGTLGTRAIKEAGGVIMVQDEQSAKFDGMPRNSIATGLVDFILPPEKMAGALMDYIQHPLVKKASESDSVPPDNLDTLTKVLMVLREHSGVDFSYYKENTILRRLERRIGINRFQDLEEYLEYLTESEREKNILHREFLIGVTRFFRDRTAFEQLQEKVLPHILKKSNVRIWCAGCSTGEEAYTLAILLDEAAQKYNPSCQVKIFATDIDRDSVEVAGKGFYPDSVLADVDPAYLARYFERRDSGYLVNERIRKMIVFATHNLLKDSPFSRLDLLVCRNLFIYLKPDVQKRLLSMFYYSLSPEGFLMMGGSETIGDMEDAFECLDSRWKLYQYKPGYKMEHIQNFPLIPQFQRETELPPWLQNGGTESVRNARMLNLVLEEFVPPSVIVDETDQILHVIGDVSPFLRIQPGNFSGNLFSTLPRETGLFVSTLLRKLKNAKNGNTMERMASIPGFEGKLITLEGRVFGDDRLSRGSPRQFYVLSFFPADKKKQYQQEEALPEKMDIKGHMFDRVDELEKELQFTRENLQATVEELETSNEELQSSNEELIASNEELQSTNEELQSVNEELYTVNSEYQSKIEELIRLNNDINNLLKNTEVGALYLDRKLCIRKITPVVSEITNILESDIGRPLAHISIPHVGDKLHKDIDKVVETLGTLDSEIVLEDGRTFLCRIRPYRTDYNAVDGILITFVDISGLKNEYQRANQATYRLERALQTGKMAWWEWDIPSGTVTFDDRKATMLGYTPEEFPSDVYEVCNLIHPDDYDQTMKKMKDFLEGKADSWNQGYRIRRKDGKYSWFFDRGTISRRSEDGKPLELVGTVIEVNELKQMEDKLLSTRDLLEKVLENSPIAKVMVNAQGKITYANQKAEELFGVPREQILQRSFDSSEWEILSPEGKPIPSEELPFSRIKESRKPLKNFQHYVVFPPASTTEQESRVLLQINGTPVLNRGEEGKSNGEIEGVVFAIEVVNDEG